ncbi:MAG: hypothetical protein ACLP4V_05125 [Methylocella sp.]
MLHLLSVDQAPDEAIFPNRTSPNIEARIVEFSLEQAAFGQIGHAEAPIATYFKECWQCQLQPSRRYGLL